MSKINLVLSPSQQTNNACKMGDVEANHMRKIANLIYEKLPKEKLNVYLIPELVTGSDNDKLRKLVQLSNQWIDANGGEGYHFALHSDAGGYAKGASMLYLSISGRNFGKPILDEISALTPWSDVGMRKRTDLWELNQTHAYAALLEVSFHDNAEEAKWIHENMEQIADACVRGICKALGV